MGITLEQAKNLEYGQILYHAENKDSRGNPQKWRVAGTPKTWKTMPERVEVPLRWGMQKTTSHMTERCLELVCLKEWEALGEKITFKSNCEPSLGFVGYMVCLGKIRKPYTQKFVDREIGEVWKSTEGKWYHGQTRHWFKTRIEAATDLLNTMLD